MGWGTDDMFVSSFDHQQMTILNTCNELHPFTAFSFVDGLGQFIVQILNQYISILCLQVSSIMCDDLAVLQRDDITANGKVIIGHLVADRCSLQGSTTFIYLIQVVAENGGVGHL